MHQFNSEEIDENRRKNLRHWLAFLSSWLKSCRSDYQSMKIGGGTTLIAVASWITYRYQLKNSSKVEASKIISLFLRYLSMQLRRYRHQRINGYRNAIQAPLSVLWAEAKSGRVQQALLSSRSIAYRIQGDQWKISMFPPSSTLQSTLVDNLTKHNIDVSIMPESIWNRIATPVLTALPFVYLYFVYRLLRQHMKGSDDKALSHDNIETNTTFADVAGIDAAVREVSEIVTFLKNPEKYTNIGASPPRGVLLHGPPGSGKTLLAKAMAGEAAATFFVACSGSAFCDTYVGRGAHRVRRLFENAKQQAKKNHVTKLGKKPSAVIFIDEIDALAKSRSSSTFDGNDERDQTLNQLLTCMDGFEPNDDVILIVIAATNRPDVLDPALLRRMERQVSVELPTLVGRQEILKIHARRVKCNLTDINWNYLAQHTTGFSGADIKNATNEAALLAVRQRSTQVKQHHWIQAVQKIQEMKNSTVRSHITMAFHPNLTCR